MLQEEVDADVRLKRVYDKGADLTVSRMKPNKAERQPKHDSIVPKRKRKRRKKTKCSPSQNEESSEISEENFHNQLVPDDSFSPEADTMAGTAPLLPGSSLEHTLSLITPGKSLVTSDKLSSHKLRSVYNIPQIQNQSEKRISHDSQSRKVMGVISKDKQEWTSPYAESLAQTLKPSSRVLIL